MNTPPTKKKMPHSCTKKQLVAMYCLDLSERNILQSINEIIRENRGFPKCKIVFLKQIAPKELKEFIAVYGLPRNYEI